MDSDFGCSLVPAHTELFQPDICEKMRAEWSSGILGMILKMLYHPLLAAVVTFNHFQRVSIKRVLLEQNIPPFSSTRQKMSDSCCHQWWSDKTKAHLPQFQCAREIQPVLPPLFSSSYLVRPFSKVLGTVKLFQSFNCSLLSTIQHTQRSLVAFLTAPLPPLLMTDGPHGEEVSVHNTYGCIWAKLVQ